MGEFSCQVCSSRESCVKLCAEAEKYAHKDCKGKNSRSERYFTPAGVNVAMDRVALLDYMRTRNARPSVRSIDLSSLTDKQRRCTELAFFEGLTLRQIGDRLCISHVSVIKHLRRAAAKLRRLPSATIFEGGD